MNESAVFSEITKKIDNPKVKTVVDDSEGFNELIASHENSPMSVHMCIDDNSINYCVCHYGDTIAMDSVDSSDAMVSVIKTLY